MFQRELILATQVLDVDVLQNGTRIDILLRRPVRIAPDGTAGVVFGGAVYPVRKDNSIELSNSSWEIADCNRFLMSNVAIPYMLISSGPTFDDDWKGYSEPWFLESNDYGRSLYFNAPTFFASKVVDALVLDGCAVTRWDISHRIAGDGNLYDWYARIDSALNDSELREQIESIFLPASWKPDQSQTTKTEKLSTNVTEIRFSNNLDAQLSELRIRSEALVLENSKLLKELSSRDDMVTSLRNELNEALAKNRKQFLEFSTALSEIEGTSEYSSSQSGPLELELLLEMAFAEIEELKLKLNEATSQAASLEIRAEDQEDQIRALNQILVELSDKEKEQRVSLRPNVAPHFGAFAFIEKSFKRIDFVFDSVDVLLDFRDPSAAIRYLVEIDKGEWVGKDLESLRSWREVSKVATGIPGMEASGRIYYKPDGGRVWVSVHLKKNETEQKRHIERLGRL